MGVPQVFLCHASEDKERILAIYKRLEDEGFEPWLDKEDLLPGQLWEEEIPKAIRSSDFVLVFLSKVSVSKRGYIQREFKLALDVLDELPEGQVFVIPVKLDDCDVPSKFRRFQWTNLFEQHGIERVISAIKSFSSVTKPTTQQTGSPQETADVNRHPQDIRTLWDSVWQKYENARGEERRRWLRKAAENGDPRVGSELRRLLNSKDSTEMLWVATAYPIPEYVDIAVNRLGEEQAYEGADFLEKAAMLIVHQIRPEHLSSVVGIAEYLSSDDSNETSSHFGSLIWFIRKIGAQNKSLVFTCQWIIQRILLLNLNPSHLCDCIEALAELQKDEVAHAPWRKHCLESLADYSPALNRANDFYNSDASYYLEALEHLAIGDDRELLQQEAYRFLDSRDIDEMWHALRILERLGAKIPREKVDGLIGGVDKLQHNYTKRMNERIKKLLSALRS